MMSLKLAILGLLMEGDKHPYLIQAQIKAREMDKYVHYQKGSLYYAVKRMEEEGLVAGSGNGGSGAGGKDKIVYRITENGKTEFFRLLREGFSTRPPAENPLFASLAFSRFLPPKELRRVLEANATIKKKEIAALERELKRFNGTIPKFGMLMANAALSRLRAEHALLARCSSASADGTLYENAPVEFGNLPPVDGF
jgi:DNA-binding PadR family transcriptional regulator